MADIHPNAKDIEIPVYLPTNEGVADLQLGKGSLKGGQLVIKFNDRLPSIAIQRMMARGEMLGISFVMVAAPSELTQEEKDARDLALLQTEEDVTPDDLNAD